MSPQLLYIVACGWGSTGGSGHGHFWGPCTHGCMVLCIDLE